MKKQLKKSIVLMGMIALTILHISAKENKDIYISAENNLLSGYVIPVIEKKTSNRILLYADLRNDKLTLSVNSFSTMSFHIIDAKGKIYVKNKLKNKSTQIDISNLPPKTYFVTVERRNETVRLFKVVKRTNTKNYIFANSFKKSFLIYKNMFYKPKI